MRLVRGVVNAPSFSILGARGFGQVVRAGCSLIDPLHIRPPSRISEIFKLRIADDPCRDAIISIRQDLENPAMRLFHRTSRAWGVADQGDETHAVINLAVTVLQNTRTQVLARSLVCRFPPSFGVRQPACVWVSLLLQIAQRHVECRAGPVLLSRFALNATRTSQSNQKTSWWMWRL